MGYISRVINLISLVCINASARYHAWRYNFYLYATYRGSKIYTTKQRTTRAYLFDKQDCLAYSTGEYIFVRNPRLICKQVILHEYEHVEQWRRYGCLFGHWNYLLEISNKGYYKNKFEVAARRAEKGDFKKSLLKKI